MKSIAGLICMFLLAGGVVFAGEAELNPADTYVKDLWHKVEEKNALQDEVANWAELGEKPDLPKLQSVAQDPKSRYMPTAWNLLAGIKDSAQLKFLNSLAAKHLPFPTELTECLAHLVKTEEDEKLVEPLLGDPYFFPYIIPAFNHTKDSRIQRFILDKKWSETELNASWVFHFIEYRLAEKLELPPKDAEPFLLAYLIKTNKASLEFMSVNQSCDAAALGFPWAATPLMKIIANKPPTPKLGIANPTADQLRAFQESLKQSRLYDLGVSVRALQKLVKVDFGAIEGAKPETFAEAAAEKAKAWWKENSNKPEYQLKAP